MSTQSAPILSTPAEHILNESTPATIQASHERLSEERLYVQYEIKRTISEIRHGNWKRIALQFPDDMLVDAPRVFDRIKDGLARARAETKGTKKLDQQATVEHLSVKVHGATLEDENTSIGIEEEEVDERLCILADTSYGACCVDEVAAEHVDADVVVHYGRSCLSPTARLPVIYVYTANPLDLNAVLSSFRNTYPAKDEKIVLMADIPYSHHLPSLHASLTHEGYSNVFKTDIVRDPSSLLPNRTIPSEVHTDPALLKDYSIFHVSTPPTTLLLILSSRIKAMHIFSPESGSSAEAIAYQMLRRRYALTTRLASVSIFGILINTLSVSNYMEALQHCQDLIAKAGKKAYVFVVGKVNAAKIANFSEIGGWIVIGCWESSLIESKEFYRPIITPFELELALMGDENRTWNGEWIGDFSQLLNKHKKVQEIRNAVINGDKTGESMEEVASATGDWDEMPSDDEPPEFDFRTGRYVSHSRPMGRLNKRPAAVGAQSNGSSQQAPPSSALVQRAKGDLAAINGQVSPAAEFLRSKRTWKGLGSDFEIAYERDDDGKIRGAAMEEGRSGVAKAYSVGEDSTKA
ncbi:uncharacterized protein MYCFIDRAFT_213175 [Pseudocercospora fijiensis CIRAD86]|uniref:2-(3-amino-3-carboxypropyl)histidine synthase subunit 2 n=1 Tax=Pseudocercospora fijiensis (strain CIRAD86) TaxID=383855 RepID=N1Q8S1_PSEFD|nr:uncharacterized protein MYCFIDRAFT_213175 [Pseudocercospora fijiensis CIRAD86]EME88166.1 hypothetical protein MYCFIDRAFT_213175 [Pseudocercospora fijiensis CIRAD86]